VSARTATQAMAVTRLDGEADEHGSDAAMASGDAVRVLDQVVRDARQAAGIIAFQWATGSAPDLAVNHDHHAIQMHAANHPETHHEEDEP